MTTFSIVTPSYNQGQFIEETINSVFSQAGDFYIDYVVVDGGSTDNTVDILRKYEELLKENRYFLRCKGITYRWVSERDRGQYPAITKGFGMTRGEIMAWLNSDDMYTPWAFKTVLDVCNRFPSVEWVTGMRTVWNSRGMMVGVAPDVLFNRKLIRNGFYPLRHHSFIQQESTFWKRSLWERIGGKVDESLGLAADFNLWMDFFRHTNLYQVHAILGGFRTHFDQKTTFRKKEYMEEVKAILDRAEKGFSKEDEKSYHIEYSYLGEDWNLREICVDEEALGKKECRPSYEVGNLLLRFLKWRASLRDKLTKKK